MKKRFSYLASSVVLNSLLLTLGFCFCGCGNDHSKTVSQAPRLNDKSPQRIVCGSPAVTEIVFALGCADRVIGVSDYSVYPPEVKQKESIGGWINLNRERLLVLKPDIIVTQGKHESLAAFATEYNIRFHSVKLNTLKDVYTAIDSIANTLQTSERGTKLKSQLREAIEFVRQNVAEAQTIRVLLLFEHTPGSLAGLSTVGPGTFLDEIIGMAGGTNIFADAKGAYPQVSKESLLIRKPEVILEISPGGLPKETVNRLRADWQALKGIPAVESGRIYYLTNDFLLIPGPRVGQAVLDISKAIHPEVFHE
jgi:iron complex transport system substrate-binding protein